MQTIFVQLKCELGRAYDVAAALAEQDGVSEVYSISGQYDLLAKCYLDAGMDIGRYVASELQGLDGVRDTYTIITFNAFT
ncbi:MAG: Lrp/AsnC ligand binding domain-containing protein [Gammaproteobacteria bacterium]|nr:Lrp/AsnC ligand binding domain-containing protein [Gammaproteobacteria bacterium]MDE0281175.1 Lrp/AsnC ligand binding domain-containing protein [Gammaproteobacteria bacterium]MDE0714190.1 Lrp/AsnC ligand binding domain-containing protein [Gammaproteobacteria bacterium]MXX16886.1 Lrp/AsnC family transcriptional regulator [Gammaproteobacteria bacterium]MXY66083.1 Lrp/AsnC family transcriptional regulator [Gammaproteobacteria bacterium]